MSDSPNSASPKKKSAGRPPAHSEAAVAAALRDAQGFVSVAAAKLGCSADSVHDAIKRWPSLEAVLKECREAMIDTAEGKLQSLINDGNVAAIIFFLKCHAKGRGYVEKIDSVPNSVPDGIEVIDAGEMLRKLRGEVATGSVERIASSVPGRVVAIDSQELLRKLRAEVNTATPEPAAEEPHK